MNAACRSPVTGTLSSSSVKNCVPVVTAGRGGSTRRGAEYVSRSSALVAVVCPRGASACAAHVGCRQHEGTRKVTQTRARLGQTALLLLFQTRALMCDVYDHNDMAMKVTENNWWQVTWETDSRRPRHSPSPRQRRTHRRRGLPKNPLAQCADCEKDCKNTRGS